MGRARRKWNPEEDALLRKFVSAALAESRPLLWRQLAKDIPGRSNKDCRRRWWNSLADGTAKGLWSEKEDAKLVHAVKNFGTNWRVVAQHVGSRTSDQCSSHWTQVLDPEINHCNWTSLEDDQLLHEVLLHGTNWTTISTFHLPRRTTLALKNRYSRLRHRHENQRKRGPSPAESKFDTLSASEISKAGLAEISCSCVASPHNDGGQETEAESELCGPRGSDSVGDDTDNTASGHSTLGSVASVDMELWADWASALDASNEGYHRTFTNGSAFSQLWNNEWKPQTSGDLQSPFIDPRLPFEADAHLSGLVMDPFTPEAQAFELDHGHHKSEFLCDFI